MCMGLAHDYGCVWDLKWCPSGCWQNPDVEETGQGSEVKSDARMGLLGMACSDGTVRVWCVLHPKKNDLNQGNYLKPVFDYNFCNIVYILQFEVNIIQTPENSFVVVMMYSHLFTFLYMCTCSLPTFDQIDFWL